MSREIKFRYWHKKEKRFVYLKAINFIDDMVTYDCQGECNYVDIAPFDDITPQQYTGLKDKNGDEIYEGDIVKATSDQYENENFVGKVIFDEGCFLTWINKNDIRGIWGEDDIEVVGNIFENSELLK
jgi:uncharacterized phage protein (TIGR01671 family)